MILESFFPTKLSHVSLTVFIFLALCFGCSENKPEQKTCRIGIMCGVGYFADTADGFKEKMSLLGYREGETIIYDMRQEQEDQNHRKQVLQQFVRDKVDLIFSFPTQTSLDAKAAVKGTNIPVVFANANIEGVDLVHSIRNPGGNISGVRYPGPQLAIKRFELMLEIVPQVKRMWIPYLKGYPIVDSQLKALYAYAASLGITFVEVPAADAADLKTAFKDRAPQYTGIENDTVLIIAEPLAVNPEAFDVIGQFGADYKIPVGGAMMVTRNHGSVFGVSTKNTAVGRQAAVIADKILKGEPAGKIPVVSAESFLSINYKAAQKLGLEISEGLLSRADEIIR
jgi:putative ABC transport system substrate-binding protein